MSQNRRKNHWEKPKLLCSCLLSKKKVGATVGVGWCESKNGRFRGVNLGLFSRIVVSWVVTLLFTSIISASLFSFFVGFYVPRVTEYHIPSVFGRVYARAFDVKGRRRVEDFWAHKRLSCVPSREVLLCGGLLLLG